MNDSTPQPSVEKVHKDVLNEPLYTKSVDKAIWYGIITGCLSHSIVLQYRFGGCQQLPRGMLLREVSHISLGLVLEFT